MVPIISLTLAAAGLTGGRQIIRSGSSTPRGGLQQLLARTTPGHLPWRPAPVVEVILATSLLPRDVPPPMAVARHGSTLVPAGARTLAGRLSDQPPPSRRARPLTT